MREILIVSLGFKIMVVIYVKVPSEQLPAGLEGIL